MKSDFFILILKLVDLRYRHVDSKICMRIFSAMCRCRSIPCPVGAVTMPARIAEVPAPVAPIRRK